MPNPESPSYSGGIVSIRVQYSHLWPVLLAVDPKQKQLGTSSKQTTTGGQLEAALTHTQNKQPIQVILIYGSSEISDHSPVHLHLITHSLRLPHSTEEGCAHFIYGDSWPIKDLWPFVDSFLLGHTHS